MTQKFRVLGKDNKKTIKVKSIHVMEDKDGFSIDMNPLEFISKNWWLSKRQACKINKEKNFVRVVFL